MKENTELAVKMRVGYWTRGGHAVEEYRVVQPNGWGGSWQSTPYLALASYRKARRG